MLVLDVDGVLTDGSIIYGGDGSELKRFHVRDGSGLRIWHQAGRQSAVISGRTSPVVEIRARELGVGHVLQGIANKLTVYQQLLTDERLRSEKVCFVGDDLPDLPVLGACGLAVAVADASADVRAMAHYVTQARGGRGAVRETIELILGCQGLWHAIVEQYRNGGS
jgi:3-deoxy-D-manno-octulosonate 8-phosphate phosphatase (KDO 8-P phosphatase)